MTKYFHSLLFYGLTSYYVWILLFYCFSIVLLFITIFTIFFLFHYFFFFHLILLYIILNDI